MTKLHLLCFVALAIGCTNVLAESRLMSRCPLYSDESEKEFHFGSDEWLCDYQNGRLRAAVHVGKLKGVKGVIGKIMRITAC